MSSSDDDFRIKRTKGGKSARIGISRGLKSTPVTAQQRRKAKVYIDSSSDSDDNIKLSKTIHYPKQSFSAQKLPQNRTTMPKFKKKRKGDMWGDSSSDDDYEDGEDDESEPDDALKERAKVAYENWAAWKVSGGDKDGNDESWKTASGGGNNGKDRGTPGLDKKDATDESWKTASGGGNNGKDRGTPGLDKKDATDIPLSPGDDDLDEGGGTEESAEVAVSGDLRRGPVGNYKDLNIALAAQPVWITNPGYPYELKLLIAQRQYLDKDDEETHELIGAWIDDHAKEMSITWALLNKMTHEEQDAENEYFRGKQARFKEMTTTSPSTVSARAKVQKAKRITFKAEPVAEAASEATGSGAPHVEPTPPEELKGNEEDEENELAKLTGPLKITLRAQPIWTTHPHYPRELRMIIAEYEFNNIPPTSKRPKAREWADTHKAEMIQAEKDWNAKTKEEQNAYLQQYKAIQAKYKQKKNISNPVAAQPKGFEYEGETYDHKEFLRVLFNHVQNWEHRTQLRVTARNTTKLEKERIVMDWLKYAKKDNNKDLPRFKQALEALKATKAPVQKEQPRSAATPSSAFGAQPISLSTPSSAEPVTEAPAKSSSEIKNDQSLKVKEESDRKVAQLEKEKAEKLATDEAHKKRVAEKTTTPDRLNEFLFGGPEGKAIADYDKEIASKKKLGEKAQGNIELRDLLGSSADTVTEAETDMEKARAPATSSSSIAHASSAPTDPTEVPFDNFLREQNLDKDIDKVMPAINISHRMLSLSEFGAIIKINDIEDALYKHILHVMPGDPKTPEHTWHLRRATDYLYRVSEAKYRAYQDAYKLRKIIHDRTHAQKEDIKELNEERRRERRNRRRAKGMDIFESLKSQPRADDDPDVLSEKEDIDETAIEKQAVEELAEEKEQDDTVEQGSSPYNLQFDPATIKSYTSEELAKLSQKITLSPEKLKPSSAIAILEQLKDTMFAESRKLRESGQSWIPAIRIALTGRFVVDSRHGSVTKISERIKEVISDLRGKLKEQAERYEKAENKRKIERALKQDKRKVKK